MSEILVTGHTGFIGRQVTKILLNKGYSVCGVSFQQKLPDEVGLRQVQLDLLSKNQVDSFLKKHKFKKMIHLAWYIGPKCHSSNINVDWLLSSLNLLQSFVENGGEVFQCNGTVSEYDFKYGYLTEDLSPLNNGTLHGVCKSSLYRSANIYCQQNNVVFKWSRCFNLYGPFERSSRLMPSVIQSCLLGKDINVSNCLKFQDYLYVEDIARGIVTIFESDIQGAVNVSSGQAIQLRVIVNKIIELMDFKGRVAWGAIPDAFGDDLVVGNNARLKSLGWKSLYNLEDGLKKTINFWKEYIGV